MNHSRTILVRGGFVLLAGWASYATLGQSGSGMLNVEIEDNLPAIVCITSLADNTFRTPPDGQKAATFSTVAGFHAILPWKPGDIGPVRVTAGEYNDNLTRMAHYEGRPAYPFWREPAVLRLPPVFHHAADRQMAARRVPRARISAVLRRI